MSAHVSSNAQEAALWSERLREAGDDPGLRAAFEAWRRADPERGAAFLKAEAAWEEVQTLDGAPALEALRAETRSRVDARQRSWTREIAAVAAGLAIVALIGAAVQLGFRPATDDIVDGVRRVVARGSGTYETAIGERLVATLEDGSIVTLNTASRARVAYKDGVRGITLERGQALFEVAKDPARPFVVTAGGRTVTALGTVFEVRMERDAFEVTLLEGKVAVEDEGLSTEVSVEALAQANASATGAVLAPGEQFVVAKAEPDPVVRAADVERVTSWRDGQVIFEDDALADAVAEMNRYAKKRILLADEGLGDLRISGAFETGKTSTFVEALTIYFPIDVTQEGADRVVLAPRIAPTRG